MDKCNDCHFRPKLKSKTFSFERLWKIEQIIKGIYINLCTYHAAWYWLRRFKWNLNTLSSYRLENLSKWWIR